MASLGVMVPLGLLRNIAGALLILFGLYLLAATKIPWLNYGKHLLPNRARGTGYLRSLSIGAIFSLALGPCGWPMVVAILTLALNSQNVWQGIYLLLAYSLGLGLPFIAVGLALGALSPYLRWLNRHAYLTSIVSGALLIIIGILVLTGVLDYLEYYLRML